MRNILFSLIALFTLNTSIIAQNNVQEVVHLKNGSIIRGSIIEQVPNKSLKIQTADGSVFVYSMDEVEKIAKEAAPVRSYNGNRASSGIFGSNYDLTGYRGFVDFGYTIGTGDYGLGRLELVTSHGYQFSPYLFFGGGTGIHYYCTDGADDVIVPLFVDFRGNFTKGPIVPFAGIKAGYAFNATESFEDLGAYIAPSVGVKFMVSNKAAINFSLGYSMQFIEYYTGYGGYGYYYNTESKNSGGFSIKVGFEF